MGCGSSKPILDGPSYAHAKHDDMSIQPYQVATQGPSSGQQKPGGYPPVSRKTKGMLTLGALADAVSG